MKTPILEKINVVAEKECIPVDAFFELTYNCNLSCDFCYVVKDKEREELSFEEIRRALEELKEAGALFLTLTGGEILTRDDFFEIASYARRLGFALTLFTNGTLIDKKKARLIKSLYPLEVGISIYSADSSVHDKITEISGSHESSISGLKLLKEEGVKVVLKSVLRKENVKKYPKLIALSERLGVRYNMDPIVTPRNNGSKEPLSYQVSDADLKRIYSDKRLYPEKLRGPASPQANPFCGAGKTLCGISPYGDVYPCIQFPQKVGNIKKSSFKDIWNNSKELSKIRKMKPSDLKECKDCELRLWCGRCPGIAFLERGNIYGKSAVICRIARVQKEISG